jgi:hypothetical protein
VVWTFKEMERTRIQRRALQVKFKGKRLADDPEQDGSARYDKALGREEQLAIN